MFLVQTLVVLPDPVKAAIFALVAFVVAFVINQVALYWPWLANYLGPYKDQAIMAISAFLVAWLEAQANLFPQYEVPINAFLAFLAILITFFGLPFLTFKYLQRKGLKRFK